MDSYNYIRLPHQLSLPKVLFLHHQHAYDGKHLGGLNLSVALSLVALSHSYERGSCHPVHSSLNSHQQSMVYLGMPCSSFKKICLKTHNSHFFKPSSKQLSKLSELNQHNLSWLNSIEREPICKDPPHVLPGPIAIQNQCTQRITPNPDWRYGQSR